MKIFRQLAIILVVLFIGEFLNKFLHLPVPGNVIGMIILLILLMTGIIKVEMIDDITNFLLDHLSFFFIPVGVGLLSAFDLLKGQWLPIIIVVSISTVIVIAVTGMTIQFIKRRGL